jgi:hypothetical protein
MIASITSWRSDRSARLVVTFGFGQLALADASFQRLGDPVAARFDECLCRLVDQHVDAGTHRNLGDSRAHLPCTDDAYSLNTHADTLYPTGEQTQNPLDRGDSGDFTSARAASDSVI